MWLNFKQIAGGVLQCFVYTDTVVLAAWFVSCKGEIKVDLKHNVNACMASGCIAALNIVLGTRWRSVVSLTFRPLYLPIKSHGYQLNGRRDWSQSLSGTNE